MAERGWARVDNSPQLIFEKWDLARQERIVAVHARAYLATMIDSTRAGPDERTFDIAKATGGKAAGRAYVGSEKELGRLKQGYKTTAAARSIHLSIPFIALLLIPAASGAASLRPPPASRKKDYAQSADMTCAQPPIDVQNAAKPPSHPIQPV